MSLVNEMLRDLDRRRRMPTSLEGSRLAAETGNSFGIGRNSVFVITVAGVLLMAAAGGLYFAGYYLPRQAPLVTTTLAPQLSDSLVQVTAAGASGTLEPDPAVAGEKLAARIAGERERTNGFELRIETTSRVEFEEIEKSETSLELLLSGVESLSNSLAILENASLKLIDGGLLLSMNLPRQTDFVVYANTDGENFAIVVQGFWRTAPAEPAQQVTDRAGPGAGENFPAETVANESAASVPVAPVRTQRALSLEERDRNATQSALRQVRGGQMQEAYNSLYDFIAKNPDAHQSRNTLITLLYAQQQYDQVAVLVDEGLMLAPNLATYKKFKARLLMADGRNQEAVDLLKSVPPRVTDDNEYHELLASLYQQTGDFTGAISVYQDLLRTDRTIGRWWAGLGISHEALGNNQEAVNSFEAALQSPSLENNLRQYSRNRIRSLTR